MSDIPNLKLINAVDPTKIKVTINEKFSKLTLSSNKKKYNEPTKPPDLRELEKRQSASRNLLEDLIYNADDSAKPNEYSNAILRSSSSTNGEYEMETNITETQTQEDKRGNESKNLTMQSSMEHLQLSIENELEDLTEKVSNLNVEQNGPVLKHEQLSFQTMSFVETEIIDLDESEEEESIICVSDSEEENLPPGPEDQYNLMITSDIVQCGKTGESELPCTLSNERDNRIEAFLHDVSQERRNLAAAGGGLEEDSFLVHLQTPTENVENIIRNSFKSKQIAIADTVSNTYSTQQSIGSQKLQDIALNETEPINEISDIMLFSQQNTNFNHIYNELPVESHELAARRLANDETEANTSLESVNNTIQDSDQSQARLLEEESIIISETSCEESNANDASQKQTKSDSYHGLIPSEEALSNSIQSKESLNESANGLTINISAKINIKLQIRSNICSYQENNCDESHHSSDQNDDNHDSRDGGDVNVSNVEFSTDEIDIPDAASSECVGKEKQTFKSQQNAEPCTPKPKVNANIMSSAEKLLTELYGQAWQTPDILNTLKRTNSLKKASAEIKEARKNDTNRENITRKSKNVEESQLLDDFSIFRLNIEETNMDSTRLTSPKTKSRTNHIPREIRTEPRQRQKNKEKTVGSAFKTPQANFKKKPPKSAIDRWRQIIDSDSEPEKNSISDDDRIEETIITDDESDKSNASDSSWQALTEDESCAENDENKDNDKKRPTSQIKLKNTTRAKTSKSKKTNSKDQLIYMDLSKDEVSIVQISESPPVNDDKQFQEHLSKMLDSCRYEDRPKLAASPLPTGKTKRRLFNANFGYEDLNDVVNDDENILREKTTNFDDKIDDSATVRYNGVLIPPSFNIYNKHLESVKSGKPVYKITPPRTKEPKTPIAAREESKSFKIPKNLSTPITKDKRKLNELSSTPAFKYSFLKSLDVCVGKSMCHPDALVFRENYRQKKEDLAKILYELFNSKLFNNDLNVPLQWNKKLLNTAGRCLNKKKAGQRLCVVELSEKVLTSADRLRCTLIHELCHAATWIFDGEGGHGATWKKWAGRANAVFPDLPKIGVCHQYDIEYKYTYKCTLCAAKSYYHSKSKKVENIRCSYCYGAIEIFLNKKDKEGNIMPTPVKEPTGFAKFVKEKYQQYRRPQMKHAEVMKLLSNEYAALKISDKTK